MVDATTTLTNRLERWVTPSTQPKPIDIDHPIVADVASAFDEIEQSRALLRRWLRIADKGMFRDAANLSLKATSVADDTRAILAIFEATK